MNIETFYQHVIQKCNNSRFLSNLQNYELELKDCCRRTYSQYFGQCNDDTSVGLLKYSSLLHNFRIKAHDFAQINENNMMGYFISGKNPEVRLNGYKYEEKARDKYMQKAGLNVVQCGKIVPPNKPWLIFAPDGLIIDNSNPDNLKLLEIKTPDGLQNAKNETLLNQAAFKKYLYIKDGVLILRKNCWYYDQVQLSLSILDITVCDFVVYSIESDDINIVKVTRDDAYCMNMLEKANRIYFEKVIPLLCTECN